MLVSLLWSEVVFCSVLHKHPASIEAKSLRVIDVEWPTGVNVYSPCHSQTTTELTLI